MIKIFDIKNLLFRNFIYLALAQGINQLIPLLVTPLLLSNVGSTVFGQYAIFQYILLYVSLFINFGFSLSATKTVAVMSDKKDVNAIFNSIFYSKTLNFVSVIGLFLIGLYFYPPTKILYPSYALGVTITGFGYIFYQDWLFQGKKNIFFQFICIIFSKIIYLLLLFVGIKWFTISLSYLIYIDSISIIIMGLTSHYIIYNIMKIKLRAPLFNQIKEVWKESVKAFTAGILTSFFTSINVILLGLFCSAQEVGIYAVADRVFILLSGFFAIISRVIYPDLALALYESKNKYSAIFNKNLKLITSGIIITSLIVFLLSKPLLRVLLSKTISVEAVLPVMTILLLALIFQTISALYSYQFILKLQYKIMNLQLLSVSLVNILIALIIIPKFGSIGAASITAFSFFLYYFFSYLTTYNIIKYTHKALK